MDYPYELYVDNLSFKATNSDIKHYFSRYGDIEYVRCLSDRSGKFKGAAIVAFRNPKDGRKALRNCDGERFMGRALKISEERGSPRRSPPPQDRRDLDPRNYPDMRPPMQGSSFRGGPQFNSRMVPGPMPQSIDPRLLASLLQPNQRPMNLQSLQGLSQAQIQQTLAQMQAQQQQLQQLQQQIQQQNKSLNQGAANTQKPPEQTKRQNPEIAYYKKVIERFTEELTHPTSQIANPVRIDDHGVPHLPEDETEEDDI